MKNLDEKVQEIWAQKCLSKKQTLLHALVDYSDAKKKTKDKAHSDIDKLRSSILMDSFAANYKLAGDGHKVIK